jgi:co-chaperonin GroES (HSP10)
MLMDHDVDPKEKILNELGDVSPFKIFNNQVLVAIYTRPARTKSGLYLPDQTVGEDKYQGKVGLVVAKGPSAFDPEVEGWFKGVEVNLHDWVVFRPSDGWGIDVNNVPCRIVDDTSIRGSVDRPDRVW